MFVQIVKNVFYVFQILNLSMYLKRPEKSIKIYIVFFCLPIDIMLLVNFVIYNLSLFLYVGLERFR
jgi:hypothetical protein